MHVHNWEFMEFDESSTVNFEDTVIHHGRRYKCSKCKEIQYVSASCVFLNPMNPISVLPSYSLWK
jgi:hypothetical protein